MSALRAVLDGVGGSPDELVGRDRELALLQDAFTLATDGTGGLVLIGGEAGIGKTALAGSFLRWAAGCGARILTARCPALDEPPPCGVWAELCAAAGEEDGATGPPAPDLGGPGPYAARFAATRAWLVALAARGPVAVLLDDLHWADVASLGLLRYLAGYLAALPILILATRRTDLPAVEDRLTAALPGLLRGGAVSLLDLAPLGEGALRALVRAHHPLPRPEERRLAAYLAGRSGGNPFFAREILRGLAAGGTLVSADGRWQLGELSAARLPDLLRRRVEVRVALLGSAACEHLELAAVIGPAIPLARWLVASGGAEEALVETIARALAARLLREGPGEDEVSFAHPLLAVALREGLPLPRRVALQRRVVACRPGATVPEGVGSSLRLAVGATGGDLVGAAGRARAPRAMRAGAPTLSGRELEVLRLVATGLTNAQVAARLSVTARTVNTHLTNIFAKLEVTTRTAAARRALDWHLI